MVAGRTGGNTVATGTGDANNHDGNGEGDVIKQPRAAAIRPSSRHRHAIEPARTSTDP
jgi:hypothetical protein